MSKSEFINLHVHDAKGSLLDSILTTDQIAKYAKDHGQSAIAITNHGFMSSYVDHYKACKNQGVKPIIGVEVYEVDDMFEKADSKEYRQPRYHLVLLAKNQAGFSNLLRIVSLSCTEGFYKKPLIDIKYIRNQGLGNGIICLTACQAGRLSRMLENKDTENAWKYYQELSLVFDQVYCEIQSHDTEDQALCNRRIVDFAKAFSLPYVVTTDAHMLSDDMRDSHSIFVRIGEDRDAGESYVDCYLQDVEDVKRILSGEHASLTQLEIEYAIQQTGEIADLIEDIDIGITKNAIMPKIQIDPMFASPEDYLRHLVFATFNDKLGHMSIEDQNVRRERLETELPILIQLDYAAYFIALYMIAKECDSRGIPRGYSRGSGANCLCLFMLNVTQIDSVRWDLDFSRFANLGRKSVADFDWDLSKRRRKEVIEIAYQLFGQENVAPIATFNTLSTKVAIRDIGKVLNDDPVSPYCGQIPYSVRDEVAKMIPTVNTLNDLGEEEEKEVLLRDIVQKNLKLKSIYERFPLWFKYVMDCEGLPKSMGRHAAGTLITPNPIVTYCPTCVDSDKNIMVQLEMHNAMEDLGLTKMDFLGLKTLDVVDDTLRVAGLTWSDVDINHLDLYDKKVYEEVYRPGNTIGVFQMESSEARRMCIEAQANNPEDIIVVNAANRPGTKDSFPTYCFNKLNPDKVELLHEDLRTIFGKSHYVLLYQEQALQLFRYAGFPEEEVDNARRAIGKKLPDVMSKLERQLKDGLKIHGWNDDQSDKIWNLLLRQSFYSFNRGHSVSYGLLSYLTAYLKTHYPVQFMTACLTNDSGNISKTSIFINECKRLGIKILPPHINKSGKAFTPIPNKNQILFGLMAVKGLGESLVNRIIEQRPYDGFDDCVTKIGDRAAIIGLIKAGAFPTKNKSDMLMRYAESQYEKRKYKPVSTYGTKTEMLSKWNINVDDYKVNGKIDKSRVLSIYNKLKEDRFHQDESIRYAKYMSEFREKYMNDEFMWEFDYLSMFITRDPLEESWQYIKPWDSVEEGRHCTVVCVLLDIKKKKDKNGNQFAYLDIYTPFGIIEATCWSRQFKEYMSILSKGNCLAIRGRKAEGGHLFVEDVKQYQQWLSDRKIKIKGGVV